MDIIFAILLGAIQGVTEWIPISSDGMTSLAMVNLSNYTLADAIVIALWLHVGTLLASIVYYRKDIAVLIHNIPNYFTLKKTEQNQLTTFLIIATLITGIIGGAIYIFGLKHLQISGSWATAIIGASLIITGIVLKSTTKKELHQTPTIKDALLTGTVQAFSVLPGISRSGFTVAVLLLRKYKSDQALKLSFLMSIPAVIAALSGLIFLDDIIFDATIGIAIITSFIVGLLTLKYFTALAQKVNFGYFCIVMGVLSILAVFM